LFIPGGFYHVTARGNHQQPLFSDVVDYRTLDQIVAAALEPARARLHAYCWMTNHIHLLVEIAELPLGVLMQRIGTRFARAMQKRVPTTGHLFENRYHARLVDVDEYFLVVMRYIHLNPVRAGMVATADRYPWSSHDIYCGRRQVVWVTTDFGLALFASRTPEARRRYEPRPAVRERNDLQSSPSPTTTILRNYAKPDSVFVVFARRWKRVARARQVAGSDAGT
jgi:REP element-mobilizing transposase RayT